MIRNFTPVAITEDLCKEVEHVDISDRKVENGVFSVEPDGKDFR